MHRLEYDAGSLNMQLRYAYDDEVIISWTDSSDLLKAQWMRFGAQDGNLQHYQIRNIRNPTKLNELCINNVGSFYCAPTEEEYIGKPRLT